MYLFIDTHVGDRTVVALVSPAGERVRMRNRATQRTQSRHLLPFIDALLDAEKKSLAALEGIMVVSGEGGFTALRIGVTTANALAYALDIPLVAVTTTEADTGEEQMKLGAKRLHRRTRPQVITPTYGRPPNITTSKRKKF